MCGRYYINTEVDEMRDIIAIAEENYPDVAFKGAEIFPTNTVPIKTLNSIEFMKWGFPSVKPGGRPHINARYETASNLWTFKDAMRSSRCLIPATSYFEWETIDKRKQKYEFTLPDKRVMYFAGIYKPEGFAILTRSAFSHISHIHDRMPVIVSDEYIDEWFLGGLEIEPPELKYQKVF